MTTPPPRCTCMSWMSSCRFPRGRAAAVNWDEHITQWLQNMEGVTAEDVQLAKNSSARIEHVWALSRRVAQMKGHSSPWTAFNILSVHKKFDCCEVSLVNCDTTKGDGSAIVDGQRHERDFPEARQSFLETSEMVKKCMTAAQAHLEGSQTDNAKECNKTKVFVLDLGWEVLSQSSDSD